MRKLTPFKLALILGCCTEGGLVALFAAFGSIGPCGPANDVTGFILLAHMPGIMMVSGVQSSFVAMPVIVGIGAATFSVVFYILIRLLRVFRHGQQTA